MSWYQANKARLANERRNKREQVRISRLSDEEQMIHAWQGSPLVESFPYQHREEEEEYAFLDFLLEAETE